jgi:transposase
MSRTFKTADYDATLDLTIRLGDCVPPDHLARFVVDTIAHLDLAAVYARYGSRGGQPYAPEILLALLFYGYATGVFSTRKIERATYEAVPFRFIAGNLHPDHDTLAAFRKTFLPDLKDLFVQVLLLAQVAGVLKLGNISLDGTKIHADASKSKAVSYKHLLALEAHLRAEVEELLLV